MSVELYDKEIFDKLNEKLNPERIAYRRESYSDRVPYLEAFDVIDKANEIFGYGNWAREIVELKEVSRDWVEGKNYWSVGYECIYRIIILTTTEKGAYIPVVHEDVGYGTGMDKNPGKACESAGKEAVSDGLKRCFRALGNQFGNPLYDKKQKNVESVEEAKAAELGEGPWQSKEESKKTIAALFEQLDIGDSPQDEMKKRDLVKEAGLGSSFNKTAEGRKNFIEFLQGKVK